MERRHVAKHAKQEIHIRRVEQLKKKLSETRIIAAMPDHPDPSLSPAGHDDFSMYFDPIDDTPIDTQVGGLSMVPETAPHDADSEYPLADLWNKIINSQALQLDNEFPDLFAELQASVASGQITISTPIIPTNKERELVDDSAPDFGIEIPGE